MKLDPQYNQMSTNLLMRKDMTDVSEVYRMHLFLNFLLISYVYRLCLENDTNIVFSKNICLFHEKSTKKYYLLGKLLHGLYYTKDKVDDSAFSNKRVARVLEPMHDT